MWRTWKDCLSWGFSGTYLSNLHFPFPHLDGLLQFPIEDLLPHIHHHLGRAELSQLFAELFVQSLSLGPVLGWEGPIKPGILAVLAYWTYWSWHLSPLSMEFSKSCWNFQRSGENHKILMMIFFNKWWCFHSVQKHKVQSKREFFPSIFPLLRNLFSLLWFLRFGGFWGKTMYLSTLWFDQSQLTFCKIYVT